MRNCVDVLRAAAIAVAMAVVTPSAQGLGTSLTGVARDVYADVLRLTLSFDGTPAVRHQRLEDPPRIVVELPETAVNPGVTEREWSFDDDVVRRIQFGQEGGRTRVVLDLDGGADYRVYQLRDPDRVIVDVTRNAAGTAALRPRPSPFPVPRTRPSGPALPPVDGALVAAIPVPPSASATVEPDLAEAPATNLERGFSLSRQLGLGISRIVIDPGHGGRDPGARGRGLIEAEIVLDVALRLEALLEAEPGFEVVLTRRTNVYIPLEERTAIANQNQADLFLSIHANASLNPRARGVETFFLDFARDAEAEALAARENAGSARSMRSLPEIVQAITLNDKLVESRDFATILQTSVHEQLSAVDRQVEDRGVKQAPFVVLIGATMPSALAEISFLTNEQEAILLRTDGYRQQIAEALRDGVIRYRRSLQVGVVAATVVD